MRRVSSDDDTVPAGTDQEQLEAILTTFFGAFTSGDGLGERMAQLRALFLPRAVIVKTCGNNPEVYDVESFLAPRETLLSGPDLTDFSEWLENGHIETFGSIAHWFGSYAKAGVDRGTPIRGRGMKSIQFVRTTAGWRISAAAWDDERDGLRIPDAG